MSDIRGNAAVTPTRKTSDDVWMAPNMTRDGALVTADWVMARAMEGRVIVANGGTVTTPITFGAGAIDVTEPDMAISAPSTVALVMLEVSIQMEAFGTTAVWETMISTGSGGVFGTDTDLAAGTTITNARSDAPYASLVSVGVASNADATYMTSNVAEIYRNGQTVAVTLGTADDDSTWQQTRTLYNWETDGPSIIYGDDSVQLMVFSAAQAGTGFITAKWVELPIGMLS